MRLENYWWLLIWPLLFGFLSLLVNMQQKEVVDGQVCVRWRRLPAYILAFPFIAWAGWRTQFGDTEMYRQTFRNLPVGLDQIMPYLREVEKGKAFRFIQLVFKSLISQSDIAFFTLIALIQVVIIVQIYRKYSCDFWFSFFLFIASTDYLAWVFNGIRQFLAAVLVFLCLPLIAKKRYLLAVVIVLVAAQFHITALLALPFIFVVNGRAWNLKTLLFIAAIIVSCIFVDNVTGFITQALEETAYRGDIVILKINDGTNILRVLLYSVPAMMSLVFRRYLDRRNNAFINVCANMAIVTAGFYVFSYFTSGMLMGRLPIYFSLSNYILIPWILNEVFEQRSKTMIKVIVTLVYIVFFYYQCGPVWGAL